MKIAVFIGFMITSISSYQAFTQTGSVINTDEIENVEWLLGTWEQRSARGSVYETWSMINESEYTGISYTIKNGDTVIFENIRLVQKDEYLFYIPAVVNQNQGKPVSFKSTYTSPNKLIFEAPEHDYPQVISYTRMAPDQLVAEISGPVDDGYKYQTFLMKKLQKTMDTLSPSPILGLRTTIYKVADLKEATAWYGKAFQTEPYFEEPYYVGFNIGGYELGLLPEESPETEKVETVISYWGVKNIEKIYSHFIESGAIEHEQPESVGGDLMAASVKDPWGNIIGLIYNPAFRLVD